MTDDLCSSRVLDKKLFHRQRTGKHPLLFGEGYHVLDVVMVFFESLIKGMLAKEVALLLQIGTAPGETQAMGLLHEFIVGAARCGESLKQAGCHPRVVLKDIRLDND